ncbi:MULTISPECIES: site-specific integrase [Clostridium]|uniref:Site-specific integrase n=2 Tax=Clostridium TaxID=1485 RepID=A0ABM5NXI0_9CLOT|nr:MULTISPECIES: site-specific integrase [Clostridium]ADK14049.1 putative phage-related integrase [Clostridium ljungdahlii DSM 13528]AGY77277.1 site-specific integrase [Clostridium autoethanogenum DSM 10061]ALU37419.1 hypothetical protein CLAU_2992 [Clostridium autoethanogenum DSM 10061]OAA87538.1 hypothetical protein WX45_03659 [Clostridium ljungdahlii DSM 13528]OVY48484.1 hypothetical protein WX72_01360 [Clostridium autoethanogenum]
MQIKNSTKLLLKYDVYARLLKDYLSLDEFNNLSPLTISSRRLTIVSFMNYLGDNGVASIYNCNQKNVTNYLISICNLASSTISGRTFILRHFFNYLYNASYIMYSGNEFYHFIHLMKLDG